MLISAELTIDDRSWRRVRGLLAVAKHIQDRYARRIERVELRLQETGRAIQQHASRIVNVLCFMASGVAFGREQAMTNPRLDLVPWWLGNGESAG